LVPHKKESGIAAQRRIGFLSRRISKTLQHAVFYFVAVFVVVMLSSVIGATNKYLLGMFSF
ncbi:MAG: hypothetical protein PHY48_16520, partial [Candidatus Cloacimonetes bacterium]|nr:hypothetical protein [Candidatus Cloacimonadota bacterium]